MEDGRILDSQLSASSELILNSLTFARPVMSATQAWLAATNDANQWFQVDLNEGDEVIGVTTIGLAALTAHVSMYKVEYSIDGVDWTAALTSDTQSDVSTGCLFLMSSSFYMTPPS